MFWWPPWVPISFGSPWSLLCLARVQTRLFLLLLGVGGGLVCESVNWQIRNAVDPFWWKAVQEPCIAAIHLSSVPQSHYICRQVKGGKATPVRSGFLWWHWPIEYVSSFFKRTADVLAPCLAVVFRRFLRFGSFPVCWRVDNVTPIPKGPPSSSVANYIPISLTPIL